MNTLYIDCYKIKVSLFIVFIYLGGLAHFMRTRWDYKDGEMEAKHADVRRHLQRACWKRQSEPKPSEERARQNHGRTVYSVT